MELLPSLIMAGLRITHRHHAPPPETDCHNYHAVSLSVCGPQDGVKLVPPFFFSILISVTAFQSMDYLPYQDSFIHPLRLLYTNMQKLNVAPHPDPQEGEITVRFC